MFLDFKQTKRWIIQSFVSIDALLNGGETGSREVGKGSREWLRNWLNLKWVLKQYIQYTE